MMKLNSRRNYYFNEFRYMNHDPFVNILLPIAAKKRLKYILATCKLCKTMQNYANYFCVTQSSPRIFQNIDSEASVYID